jgi:hypothetical protein
MIPNMVWNNHMGAVQLTTTATRAAVSARTSAKKMAILEMKLRIGKIVDEEERMMFAVSEMGEAGIEWFVALEEKPANWEEMKKN